MDKHNLENWFVTYRGIVLPRHCDHYGHLNVRFYAHFFDDGGFQMWHHIGIKQTDLTKNGMGVVVANISIDFDESNNSAIGKVMCFNPMEDKKGKVFFLGMWYNDKYQRTKDGWKISERIEESSWSLNAPINTK